MSDLTHYLTPKAAQYLADQIRDADGSEVFAVLRRDDPAKPYDEAEVLCRGTLTEVPALMTRVQPGDMTLHNHPSGVLQPSQADMNIAGLFGENGAGAMIVDNLVTRCYVIVEPARDIEKTPIAEASVRSVFEQGGALSQQIEHYEPREGQLRMALDVADAINDGEVLTVEAGTGTGKSLAYLVPALIRARDNKEKVVIATKTISLQEQLVYKDIPLARELVPNAPRASLVKGRGNYVCLRKLQDLRGHQLSLFPEEDEPIKRDILNIAEWIDSDGSGDKANLPFIPRHDAWEAVRSDADMCLGIKCPHYQHSPFYNSRREAAGAGILVVNQALLFSDLAIRTASRNYTTAAVIPPYQHVILDEAHNIEVIAGPSITMKSSSGTKTMLSISRKSCTTSSTINETPAMKRPMPARM